MAKKKQQGTLKTHSVRLDQKQLQLAILHKINIGELLRNALGAELAKREGTCPTCGHKTKKEWEPL